MINDIISIIFLGTIMILPVSLVALDIVFAVKKKEKPIFELIAFFIGSIYMILAYMLWDLPDYRQPLNVFGTANMHEPFASEHGITLLLFALWGFMSYYVLKFTRKKLPPVIETFFLAGVYAGCGLSIVWIFQLICGARPERYAEYMGHQYSIDIGIFDLVEILCLCVVPVIFLIHAIYLMVCIVKEKAEKQESIRYENPVLNSLNQALIKGARLFYVAMIMLIPVLGILVMLLCLFGQKPDSIILAFTQTSDWILSKEIAPPPVAYDTHYLCTVSLRGHKKLVKPIRYGLRRGEKIVVNRQLCVANAFEELIMERMPRFHKAIRNFYDTYGYPISKHIHTPLSADITYLIMKPLEWIFVLVLYLADVKPEDRIARQYLPLEK